MNEHAGPACALSGLIVGIFAVLLHDKVPPPPVPNAPARDALVASPTPKSGSREGVVSSRPAEKFAEAEKAPVAVAVAEPRPAPTAVANAGTAKAAGRSSIPANPKPVPPSPRPPFAIVEPGESLADVAARVYGTRDATETLWKANRDQVEKLDSNLPRGTLLRTP